GVSPALPEAGEKAALPQKRAPRRAPIPFCRGRTAARETRGAAGGRRPAGRPFRLIENDQRFENWKLRRAPALPYFLRSTTRESRVRKPPCFNGGRGAAFALFCAPARDSVTRPRPAATRR